MYCRDGSCTFQNLIHELFKKDTDVVPEKIPLVFFCKSDVYMANNDKYANHTRHISSRMHFLRNDEKCKMHNID